MWTNRLLSYIVLGIGMTPAWGQGGSAWLPAQQAGHPWLRSSTLERAPEGMIRQVCGDVLPGAVTSALFLMTQRREGSKRPAVRAWLPDAPATPGSVCGRHSDGPPSRLSGAPCG